MTSVCPALCPPWKRTTTSARADSQSTIFPLPSSPHWAPITATLAMLRKGLPKLRGKLANARADFYTFRTMAPLRSGFFLRLAEHDRLIHGVPRPFVERLHRLF